MSGRRAAQAAALAVVAVCWFVAAWLLWRTEVPGSLHLPHLDPRDYFSQGELDDAASFERVSRIIWVGGVVVELAVFVAFAQRGAALRARVGGRADGHRDAARHDRLRAAVAGRAAVRGAGALVGAAARPRPPELLRGDRRRLARARRAVRVPLRRARDRDGVRAADRRLVVDPGRARVRRRSRCCSRSSRRTSCRPRSSATRSCRRPSRSSSSASTSARSRSSCRRSGATRRCRTPRRWASGRAGAWCCGTRSSTAFSVREVRVVIGHEFGHIARDHTLKLVAWFALFALPLTFLLSRVARMPRRHGAARGGAAVPARARRARPRCCRRSRTRSSATSRPRPTGSRCRRRATRRPRAGSSSSSCRRR